MNYRTEQEGFWAGAFGNDYIERNQGRELLAANLHFFARALRGARGIDSCIEFGANVGMNLQALKLLFPRQQHFAVEINAEAARRLGQVIPPEHIANRSILEFVPQRTHDLVLIKGVLIHINPDVLPEVYDKLVAASHRYVLVAEYYNPSPVAIAYRGHGDRLFKRDFAGEMMQRHPNLQLVDYGFAYHHDEHCPQDDVNWFLLEKRG